MACLAARSLSARPICASRSRRRQHVVAAAASPSFQDPYSVLGVPATADETEIKRAYRSKAKLHHPDVSKQEGSAMVFLQLTEAYDFLIGKLRGGGRDGVDGTSNGWEWHDWYWSFRINRTWRQQHQGSSQAPPRPKPAAASNATNIREQLAGLRQRAAIRATKARSSPSSATSSMSSMESCSTLDEEEAEEAWQPESEGRPSTVSTSTGLPPMAAAESTQHAWSHSAAAEAPRSSLPQHEAVFSHGMAPAAAASHHTAGLQQPQAVAASASYAASASCQAPDQQDHHHHHHHQQPASAFASAAPQRRKFASHSGTRDNVQHQLAGLRRKAMIVNDFA